ncbi:MAG: universal stress protein [Veillonellaceae bacterium]|nr:universal stress protein [Veillonellaceae bacterium]
MFNRILIPLDGSLLAERAIPHAEQFARIFGAKIVLLRVLEVATDFENQFPTDPLSWQLRKAEADMYMQSVASRIRDHLIATEKHPEERVEYAVLEGRTAENIIDFAHNMKVDLLVISSHGSGGLSRWGMSSVIQKVIDLIYLPLLIIRSYDLPGETDETTHYRRILLPIDSSRRAECAFSPAIVLAKGGTERAPKAENEMQESEMQIADGDEWVPKLLLASVISPPEIPIPAPYPVEIHRLSEQLLHVSRQAVLAYLSEMKLRLPVESETRVVESKNISSAIQELAEQENIDLVVMSAHGYSGHLTYPYGSVTRNSIEFGNKSLLVIQDIPLSQVRLTASAVAAEKTGRR